MGSCEVDQQQVTTMKLLICAAVLVAGAMARPGGYTGYGGVYQQMNVDAQTMEGAKGAAKMAVESSIFNDESLTGALEQRNVRKATYVPNLLHCSRTACDPPPCCQCLQQIPEKCS